MEKICDKTIIFRYNLRFIYLLSHYIDLNMILKHCSDIYTIYIYLNWTYSLSLEPNSSRACSWSSQMVFSWMFSSCRRWNSWDDKKQAKQTKNRQKWNHIEQFTNKIYKHRGNKSHSAILCLSLYFFTCFSILICRASVLSCVTVPLSLSRSFCNVCLHSLSIFRSVSSCWL